MSYRFVSGVIDEHRAGPGQLAVLLPCAQVRVRRTGRQLERRAPLEGGRGERHQPVPLPAFLGKRSGAQVVRARDEVAEARFDPLRRPARVSSTVSLVSASPSISSTTLWLGFSRYAFLRAVYERIASPDSARARTVRSGVGALRRRASTAGRGRNARSRPPPTADLHRPVADPIERKRRPRAPAPFEAQLHRPLEDALGADLLLGVGAVHDAPVLDHLDHVELVAACDAKRRLDAARGRDARAHRRAVDA